MRFLLLIPLLMLIPAFAQTDTEEELQVKIDELREIIANLTSTVEEQNHTIHSNRLQFQLLNRIISDLDDDLDDERDKSADLEDVVDEQNIELDLLRANMTEQVEQLVSQRHQRLIHELSTLRADHTELQRRVDLGLAGNNTSSEQVQNLIRENNNLKDRLAQAMRTATPANLTQVELDNQSLREELRFSEVYIQEQQKVLNKVVDFFINNATLHRILGE